MMMALLIFRLGKLWSIMLPILLEGLSDKLSVLLILTAPSSEKTDLADDDTAFSKVSKSSSMDSEIIVSQSLIMT